MKISKVVNWLSKSLFQPTELGNPISLEIVNYEEVETAKGTSRRLSGKHITGKVYSFDIFGENVNQLIDILGDDTDLWKGTKIQVSLLMRGDKEIKQIKVLPK